MIGHASENAFLLFSEQICVLPRHDRFDDLFLGDLLAGATLGFMTNTLTLLPGLMVLIPPAIGMRGNIFGALGSRLGTAMHIGTFEFSFRRGSILRQNMESSLLLTLIVSFLMGVLAKIMAEAFGISSTRQEFVFISVLGEFWSAWC